MILYFPANQNTQHDSFSWQVPSTVSFPIEEMGSFDNHYPVIIVKLTKNKTYTNLTLITNITEFHLVHCHMLQHIVQGPILGTHFCKQCR